MTATDTWFDIPDFSRYEITKDGVVRIKYGQTEPYFRNREGQIIELEASTGPHPFYCIASDTQNSCVITKTTLLKLVFNTTD